MVGLARVSAFGFPCKTIPAKLVGGGHIPTSQPLPASPAWKLRTRAQGRARGVLTRCVRFIWAGAVLRNAQAKNGRVEVKSPCHARIFCSLPAKNHTSRCPDVGPLKHVLSLSFTKTAILVVSFDRAALLCTHAP